MDAYLEQDRKKFVTVHDLMPEGSSRKWARPQRESGLLSGGGAPTAHGAGASATTDDLDDGESSDGSIEDHPFFAGLKEAPKEEVWDAETILTTYTTTDNHPTTIRVARKPKRSVIALDPKTGLPVGTMLPAEEERLRARAEAGMDDEYDEADDFDGGGVNAGAARPKKEGADERRARKALARTAKAERRVEKKGTKGLFKEEKATQERLRQVSRAPPSTSLSRW